MTGGRVAIWSAAAVVIGSVAGVLIIKSRAGSTISLTGVVLTQDMDARRQLPIPSVEITATNGATVAAHRSDPRGFFRLNLARGVWQSKIVTLKFRHPNFRPLDITKSLSDQIFIVRMVPVASRNAALPASPETAVTDVRVRYGVKTTTTMNVGSTVKTFEVANVGNVPCDGRSPCSPDGKWKATIRTMTLAAGEGHEFRNVRVSCIAGPCPFTRIESDGFSHGGGTISVSVRNWSDAVAFLVEADVTRTMVSDVVRQAYPAIFGRALNFTLPAAAQGPSLEAEMNGAEIVFPLGPGLNLSWAVCNLQIASDQTKQYECELRPGYQFR